MEDEEKGFTVTDRRASQDMDREESETPETPEIPSDSNPEDDEEMAGTADVYSLAQWMIAMLAEGAWMWMGLHLDPITKKSEKDLTQARIAVDSAAYLYDQIAAHIPEEERRAIRDVVSDLRINFVEQSKS